MKVSIHMDTSQSWAHPWKHALAVGIAKCGDTPDVSLRTDGEIVVVWGQRGLDRVRQFTDAPVLVLERGFIGRRMITWTSAGFNGICGRAVFPDPGEAGIALPDRTRKHFLNRLRPWHNAAKETAVVIMGQCPGDAQHAHANIDAFYRTIAEEIRNCSKWPIKFRPHPNTRPLGIPGAETILTGTPLTDVLNRARLCVTFNSNSGVDAVMNGCPVYAHDAGSMAYPIASHNIREALERRHTPDRIPWLNAMAFTQWRMDEFSSGEAWEAIRQCTHHTSGKGFSQNERLIPPRPRSG